MPDEKKFERIGRVYRGITITKQRNGTVRKYLTWYGWYWDGGKRITVYLGRELPERFQCLVGKRRFKRIGSNPDFPSAIARAKKDRAGGDRATSSAAPAGI
jgi:hypothetical protein